METVEHRYDPEMWAHLGKLLQARRRVGLGYRYRPKFCEDRHINVKMVQEIENNERPNTYPPLTLSQIAAAYQVTAGSLFAVLEGNADQLEPVRDPAPGDPDTARGRVQLADAFAVLAGPGLDHYRYVTAADLAAKPPRLRSATERKIMSNPDRLVSMDQKCEIIAGLRWGLDMADQQGESSGLTG